MTEPQQLVASVMILGGAALAVALFTPLSTPSIVPPRAYSNPSPSNSPSTSHYTTPCPPGQIATNARCITIPDGPVILTLNAGDVFTLAPGEVGHLSVTVGSILVQNRMSRAMQYIALGTEKLVVTTDIMKAETNGTRAEYRPVQ